jgi:rubrerythrin
MDTKMTACDLIGIARSIEETGRAAYLEMKVNNNDPRMLNLLQYLADEESSHVTLFEKMGNEMTCQMDRMPDPSPEDQAYLSVILKSALFRDPKAGLQRARDAKTPLDVLKFSLQFERDAMLFWLKLYQLVREPDRPLIQKLIREEEEHVREIDHLMTQHQMTERGGIPL